MPSTVSSRSFGSVAVTEDLIELVGPDVIDNAVAHLRTGGGDCKLCGDAIRPTDQVSMVARLTSAGYSIGFLHYRCGPPQTLDDRRSRRASLRMAEYLREVSADAQAFALIRDYPAPHAVLVVSAQTPSLAREENGDTTRPWLNLALEQGFTRIAPDVLDAAPALLKGWCLDVTGELIECGTDHLKLFSGTLDIPSGWFEALQAEGQCLVIAAGLGVSSTELGSDAVGALNALAAKGLVACTRVATGTLSRAS